MLDCPRFVSPVVDLVGFDQREIAEKYSKVGSRYRQFIETSTESQQDVPAMISELGEL